MASASVPTKYVTPQEYLDRERTAAYRSQYYRGEMFAMAGATHEHNLAKDNFARETGNQLKDGPCHVVTSDQRVKIEKTGLYTYPDVVVICGQSEFEDDKHDTLLNPHALVEVLSDSTEKFDRGLKFGHYRQIPTLKEYILVAQDRPLVERYMRQADDTWVLTEYSGLAQTFAFATIPVQIPLAEIYRGVEFPENPDGQAGK